jgi:hypothetical protein
MGRIQVIEVSPLSLMALLSRRGATAMNYVAMLNYPKNLI